MTVKCMYYPDLSNTPATRVASRINTLTYWGSSRASIASPDPRCGCGAPDDICEWDDVAALEELLPVPLSGFPSVRRG